MFRMTPTGTVTAIPLSGTPLPAAFSGAGGIAFDTSGNYLVCDYDNGAIYKITPAGVLSVFASGGVLSRPLPIIRDPGSGNFIVADYGSHVLLSIGPSGSPVQTLASGGPLGQTFGLGLISPSASVTPAPTVTAVNPNSGPTTGGTSVTITGTNLTGATSVTFAGAAAASFTVVNSTTITATAPAGAVGTASVIVTTAGGSNSANTLYTYTAPSNTSTPSAPTLGIWGMLGLAGLLTLYAWRELRKATR
jgi:hypothetical protein